MRPLVLAALCLSLPALAEGPPTASSHASFASLPELDAALDEVARGGDVEALWARVTAAPMPLVFGQTTVFFHRAAGVERVEWRGEFSGWEGGPAAEGRRVGDTDVFTFRRDFPPGARLDYKLVELSARWLVDPLNPRVQLGGYGPNSELRMPGWTPPAHVVRRPGTPAGTLGPPERVASRHLGYDVTVRVYTPAPRPRPAARLPVLYVTDGSDYWTEGMGDLVTTLDNLIADGRLPPLVAVFVDPWDQDRRVNRRQPEFLPGWTRADPQKPFAACPFCDFLVDELRPRVEGRFRADPERRAILGTSLGGLHAAFMGARHPDVFRLIAIQSPSIIWQPWLPPRIAGARATPRRVAITVGSLEERLLPGARALRDAYAARGVPLRYLEVPQDHSWGQWRDTAAAQLEYLLSEERP
jgi:enterochelin esterase family protein